MVEKCYIFTLSAQFRCSKLPVGLESFSMDVCGSINQINLIMTVILMKIILLLIFPLPFACYSCPPCAGMGFTQPLHRTAVIKNWLAFVFPELVFILTGSFSLAYSKVMQRAGGNEQTVAGINIQGQFSLCWVKVALAFKSLVKLPN